MSLRSLRSAILLASLLLSATACNRGGGKDAAAAASLPGELRQREATRVRVASIVKREMVRTLSTATTVESELEITLFPRTAGVVTALLVEEGDAVAADTELAHLDARAHESALAEARVALREAEESLAKLGLSKQEAYGRWERAKLTFEQAGRDYERNEKAALISAQDLDRLRLARDTAERDLEGARIQHEVAEQDEKSAATAIERAKLAVEKAELDLSYTRLTAPFAGVIARRNIKVGDSVSGATAAFVLTDPEHLRAVFHRPQRELPLFRAAMEGGEPAQSDPIEIRVTSEALPGEEFQARVRMVSPTIDPSSGSFRITVDLVQPGEKRPRLLPGMLVRLAVVTERHEDALVIPKRALMREGESNYVFKIVDSKAQRIEVREGFSDDVYVEAIPAVAGQLAQGDAIVVVGNRDLEQDTPVQSEAWTSDEVHQDARLTQAPETDSKEKKEEGAQEQGESEGTSEQASASDGESTN